MVALTSRSVARREEGLRLRRALPPPAAFQRAPLPDARRTSGSTSGTSSSSSSSGSSSPPPAAASGGDPAAAAALAAPPPANPHTPLPPSPPPWPPAQPPTVMAGCYAFLTPTGAPRFAAAELPQGGDPGAAAGAGRQGGGSEGAGGFFDPLACVRVVAATGSYPIAGFLGGRCFGVRQLPPPDLAAGDMDLDSACPPCATGPSRRLPPTVPGGLRCGAVATLGSGSSGSGGGGGGSSGSGGDGSAFLALYDLSSWPWVKLRPPRPPFAPWPPEPAEDLGSGWGWGRRRLRQER